MVRTGQSELCPDTLEAAWVRSALGVDTPEHFLALGARSYMCVPLKVRGDTFGAITFVSVARGRSYGAVDLALAEELARRAGLAVDNARLFREAQEALEARDEFLSMASHDLRTPLTSLRMQLQAVRSNAVKYGNGQPVDITVSTDGTTARLEIRDQGVGVAPEDQERLFERFERVRLGRGAAGYGVGLWIVRRVVEAHGGSISIESRLGEGASFIVQLPSRGQEQAPNARERPPTVH